MELGRAGKKHTLVTLENNDEARLFASEGLGLVSIKGFRLVLDVLKSRADNQWPIELTVSNRRLEHAGHRMSDEAARLSVIGAMPGFGEYPEAVENEFNLRSMSADISEYLETTREQAV